MPLQAFLALQTQWRVIVGGASVVRQGLDYASIQPVMEMLRVPAPKRRALFADLRVMEAAALAVYNAPEDSEG